MKNIYPQTKAKELSKYIESIANYSCLAMCYLFCIGIELNEYDFINYVAEAIKEGLLDDDCSVKDGATFLNRFAGVDRFTVSKKEIKSISEIKQQAPVRFDYNGTSHWVVVENGKIIFNPLKQSTCVDKGKPTTARIIELRK